MWAARVVLISNPHNPTGSVLGSAELTAVALRHSRSVLVVDESYVEFLRDPATASMVGCPASNVVVLRSASKFYGIAATRAGVAWCRDRHVLPSLVRAQETGGLSGLDVTVATAALVSQSWAVDVRNQLLAAFAIAADIEDYAPPVPAADLGNALPSVAGARR